MATIQQSIDIKAPVHVAYTQLTQFEDYPRFMDEVASVRQIDDTHLHWKTVMSSRDVEWDAEITEQDPDHCIAWHNTSGPANAGKIEVQPLDADTSRVTFTLRAEPEQVPGSSAGNSEQEMALRLKLDLARLKDLIEARDVTTGQSTPAPSDMAGTEIWAGNEGSSAPTAASPRAAVQQQGDLERTMGEQQTASSFDVAARNPQVDKSMSPENASSQPPKPAPQSRRSFAAEEIDSNHQPGRMRHLGEMPQDTSAERNDAMPTSDATGKSKPEDR